MIALPKYDSAQTRIITVLALIQTLAVVYGVLACGAMMKLAHLNAEVMGWPLSKAMRGALIFRNYGWLLMFAVVAWTAFMVVKSSADSQNPLTRGVVLFSGLGLAAIYSAGGTLLAVLVLTQLGY